jgi:hypothetical protein
MKFDVEDLEAIRLLIREEIAVMKPQKEEIKYYSRLEAAQLLKITLPTLHSWTVKGLIQKSKIQNRVLYEDAEIQKMMLKMKN